jgi:hypothetical protein
MLTVRFQDFWSGFQPSDFFQPLLERSLGQPLQVVHSNRMAVDVSVQSVFPSVTRAVAERGFRKAARIAGREPLALRGPARLKLWFTGENIRPPVDGFDLTLSFDVDTYSGSNSYLPLFVTRAAACESSKTSEGAKYLGSPVDGGVLHEVRAMETSQRPNFACLILSNPEPTRLRMARELARIAPVDIYGPAVGRPLRTKAEVANRYRYIICFENSFYPGYVTEKILDAWLLGCIPLWAGFDRARLLNPAAYINLWDFADMDAMVERIAELERSPESIDVMAGQPLLNRPLDVSGVEDQIKRAWQRVSG